MLHVRTDEIDQTTGKDILAERPELSKLPELIHEGDTLVIRKVAYFLECYLVSLLMGIEIKPIRDTASATAARRTFCGFLHTAK
ncbi:hypothetical protein [Spirosoma spitsbergense]|uniref:hypothetical protein n=1 Tax=Spirosoma spitsbergense TaxID=431554 RepID=UPI0012FC8174|nr:hypothetical protein [Spirosoma spitsbergense]